MKMEKVTVELPDSVVEWLKCVAKTERKTLEEVVSEAVIEDVTADLECTDTVSHVLAYPVIVNMGLEADLLELGYDVNWLRKEREAQEIKKDVEEDKDD